MHITILLTLSLWGSKASSICPVRRALTPWATRVGQGWGFIRPPMNLPFYLGQNVVPSAWSQWLINLEMPVLEWSLKSSNFELEQCSDGRFLFKCSISAADKPVSLLVLYYWLQVRILGLTIDLDCSFHSHVDNVRMNMRKRSWTLAKLRHTGMSVDSLVVCYKTLIRAVVEYVAPVWHSLITAEQSASIKKQQILALKNILGKNVQKTQRWEALEKKRKKLH